MRKKVRNKLKKKKKLILRSHIISLFDKKLNTFPKGISPKVNLIERQEFELTHYNDTVQQVSHYNTGIPL